MHYIVATVKKWNFDTYKKIISNFPGDWKIIYNNADLNINYLQRINPRFIFFPHWNHIVPDDITSAYECICFHETNLPFGRGGSPIQNLITKGYTSTKICAIKMTSNLDSGPIYCKKDLSLFGNAEEIFIRASRIIASMILEIIENEPKPFEQTGIPSYFKRRTPEMSYLPSNCTLEQLFDHIRMLDADSYPHAFINHDKFKIEFTRSALYTNKIVADATIKLDDDEDEEEEEEENENL